MRVTVHYLAQVRRAVGRSEEAFDTVPDGTLADLVRFIAGEHPNAAPLLLAADGQPSRSLLFFVNDVPIAPGDLLPNPATVTILAPMAGG